MPKHHSKRVKSSRSLPATDKASPEKERLQKVLAAAGIASRRESELLILEGRVEVDRQIVKELGVRVDPSKQHICVDGEPIALRKAQYYMVNKPIGVVTTNLDPQRRPRVIDLINTDERLFCVGRLDISSEGLILVTNDGALANHLAHPRYGVEKIYLAEVAGSLSADKIAQILKGVRLSEGKANIARLRLKRRLKKSSQLELVLREGRNREIRRVFAKVGHKVLRLKRIAMGGIKLGDLPTGAHRKLTWQEIAKLKRAASGGLKKKSKPAKKKKAFAPTKKTASTTSRKVRTILGGDTSSLAVKRKKTARKKTERKG